MKHSKSIIIFLFLLSPFLGITQVMPMSFFQGRATSGIGDGKSSATAGTSALQIKTGYPASTNGVYWIKNSNINSNTPFQIYADMTGGGYMLLNASGGGEVSVQANTVTTSTLDSRTFLPRAIVQELAKIATMVQLRSGPTANRTANIATSTDGKPILALRTGVNWHTNNAFLSFTNTAGLAFTWSSGPGTANGWPMMYHSAGNANNVHWLPLLDRNHAGRTHGTSDWYSTWIK
jgi:hypothetical protein